MANNFTPNVLAKAFAAPFPSKLQFIKNAVQTLNPEFRAGNGATMNIVVPDYPTVVSGAVINAGTELNYQSGVRPLTLTQKHVAFGAEQAIRSLDILSFVEQVAKPYAAALASDIQKQAIAEVSAQADASVVIGSAGAIDMNKFRMAAKLIRKARSFGAEMFAIIDPMLLGQASNLANLFLPSSISEPMWKDSTLGRFGGMEVFDSADCESYTAGDCDQLAAMSVTANVAEGATSIGITFSTAPTSGTTLKKGHRFNVAGIQAVDIYGNPTGALYDFVAKSYTVGGVTADDVTFDGVVTAITVNLEKAVYATSKPNINVSALPAASDTASSVFAAGKTYLTGLIWAKEAVYVGQARLLPMAGTESTGESNPESGVLVSYTAGPDILNGREVGRWDWLGGWCVPRTNWVVPVYLPTT